PLPLFQGWTRPVAVLFPETAGGRRNSYPDQTFVSLPPLSSRARTDRPDPPNPRRPRRIAPREAGQPAAATPSSHLERPFPPVSESVRFRSLPRSFLLDRHLRRPDEGGVEGGDLFRLHLPFLQPDA